MVQAGTDPQISLVQNGNYNMAALNQMEGSNYIIDVTQTGNGHQAVVQQGN